MKNQEELFRHVGEAGLAGGFAIYDRLPRLKGKLNDFKIMTLDAVKNEGSTKFINRIIKTLGEKPSRNLEFRTRLLIELLRAAAGHTRRFILVINDAHLLHSSVVHMLKNFHELDDDNTPPLYPGIVFLGDIERITTLIKKNKGVAARTTVCIKSKVHSLDLIK